MSDQRGVAARDTGPNSSELTAAQFAATVVAHDGLSGTLAGRVLEAAIRETFEPWPGEDEPLVEDLFDVALELAREAEISTNPEVPIIFTDDVKIRALQKVRRDQRVLERRNASRQGTRPPERRASLAPVRRPREHRPRRRVASSRGSPDDPDPEPDRVARPQFAGDLRQLLKAEVDRRVREQIAARRKADRLLFLDEASV